MAKDKQKPGKGFPNRHLHARASFLYQAATYLTLQATSAPLSPESDEIGAHERHESLNPGTGNPKQVCHLGAHLRAVSQKGQLRLSLDMKHSLCKTCHALLIPGRTSTQNLENRSKGGSKPWADVFEIECNICGTKKRFPVGAKRQQRKDKR
ncbi:Rpr2-domain-containing protein, partial [Westerdykella ornata]